MDAVQVPVSHNEAEQRFEARIGEAVATVNYQMNDGTITFTHTEVPEELEGKGIAGQMAKAALDYARGNALKVVPRCSFIAGYIQRHPEYQALVHDPS
jgi:predicted GNAT family acetyltransferase